MPQQANFWNVLAEVRFDKKKDTQGFEVDVPVFSKHLQTFGGKRVQLRGYMIPIQELGDQSKFMLSSLPYSLCYFCGAAGPETVVEVEFDEGTKFVTRQIRIEGMLVLNSNNPDHHIYILKSAKLIE
ncbi:MAG: hypothetical protein HC859_09300 [Bacteroidia bacterium]|nr:hypothetical protein [Bacteroidia bacterium]